ncbi:MAG TPA: response regulator [Treponemataceae bacterium]|jgi:two-component system chemotaxis response regulator CheY|nr:response regulator [Treponema sp.]OQB03730.1 MAG: Chemotaxis protein CheY [Spirochaetes bacterium ADurb.Bin215]HOF84086.1 response regulator [Treponemataceae bacterium]HOS36413.1 response regulator [Treponemataceae bacterium]HPA10024.1 response regulator [Treponemataceae bacterium]
MGATILIVDDSVSIRQSVRFILEQSGYTVAEAADGQEGLKRLGEQKADLVITDVNMPNMDGLTMVRKIRETDGIKFVPILVLTTESQGSVIEDGKKAGATGWIVKPFNDEKLVETIKKVLG